MYIEIFFALGCFGAGFITAIWIVLVLFRFAMRSAKKAFKPPTGR